MRTEWIIVDGYNMIHKEEGGAELLRRDLFLAREHLVRKLERAIPRMADKVTVVFDGSRKRGGIDNFSASPVEVRFSAAGSSADAVIEGLVAEASNSGSIMVVTSDRLEADAVSGSGAETISCTSFLSRLNNLKRKSAHLPSKKRSNAPLGTLEEFFPQ